MNLKRNYKVNFENCKELSWFITEHDQEGFNMIIFDLGHVY